MVLDVLVAPVWGIVVVRVSTLVVTVGIEVPEPFVPLYFGELSEGEDPPGVSGLLFPLFPPLSP